MTRKVSIAVSQFACSSSHSSNEDKAEELVRKAAAAGANIVLLQELFQGLYFCQQQDPGFFSWAQPADSSPLIQRFSKLAKELGVVLPVPFFERENNAHFNSVAVIDADGAVLGVYRKTHIPDGPGYQEKFYFTPGDTGFRVFETWFGKIGVAICWDQWFPEAARALALQGAEIILYPTAIGSEPHDPSVNSYEHWARAMIGHAASNMVPVMVSNRIGTEQNPQPGGGSITFYGSSFITNETGEVLAQVGATPTSGWDPRHGNMHPKPEQIEGIAIAEVDLDSIRSKRLGWGLFRDRRSEMYRVLATSGGVCHSPA